MKIGNIILLILILLGVAIFSGVALAATLPDQVSPRNITFSNNAGVNNASWLCFNDSTCATSWTSYVTTSVLSAYQALVHANFTSIGATDAGQYVNITALQANPGVNYYTNITDLQSSNASTNTRIDSLNSTKGNASIISSSVNQMWFGGASITDANSTSTIVAVPVSTMGIITLTGSGSGGTAINQGVSGSNRGESSVYRIIAYGRPLEFMTTSSNSTGQRMVIDSSGNIAMSPSLISNSTGGWMKTAYLWINGTINASSNMSLMGNLTVFQNTTLVGSLSVPVICLNGDCKAAWPSGGTVDYVPLQVNDTYLNASINAVDARATAINASLLSFVLILGQNDTNLNASINAVNTRVTTVNNSLQLALVNITDLQNSNTSTNTRINTINTTVQNLLSSNTSIYTRIDTVNTTVQNLLTSNTTVFGLILQLGQNDTNLNTSINAVNTRATTINNSLQLALVNITDLQNSNSSTNTRINNLNTSTAANESALSTFAQTKAATGYSGDCPTGIAGITLNNGSAANKTCAPAQSGGTGNVTSDNGTAGWIPRFVNATGINTGSLYDAGNGVVYWATTGLGSNLTAVQTVLSTNTSTGNAIIIGPEAFRYQDFDRTLQAQPTLYIFSNNSPDIDNTQYLKIGHNGTHGRFEVGNGSFAWGNSSGTFNMNLTQGGVLEVGGRITSNGTEVLTGYSTGLINTTLLNSTDTAAAGECLTASGTDDQFTWTACGSGGSGNVTAWTNGTLGYYAVWTNSTGIKNGSLYEDTSGNLASKRNINIKSDDNGDRCLSINGTCVVYWVQASNRARYGITGRTSELMGTGMYFGDGGDFDFSSFDTANNSVSFLNTDTGEVWVNFDDKVGVNHTVTANSKALTVIGETNLSTTVYLGGYTSCAGTLGVNSLGAVICQTNGSGTGTGSGNVTSDNGTAGWLARFVNSTGINTGAIYDAGNGVAYFGQTGIGVGVNYTAVQAVISVNTSTGNAVIIGPEQGRWQDFDRTLQSNPTLYLFSNTSPDTDNTQYAKMAHNGSMFRFETGNGSMGWGNASGTFNMNLTQDGVLEVAGRITSNGTEVLTGYSTGLINITLLNATNSPSSGQVPSYSGTDDQFTWITPSTGSGSGNVTSSNGTVGYIARFLNSTEVATGSIFDNGSNIGIGTLQPNATLEIRTSQNIIDPDNRSQYHLVLSRKLDTNGAKIGLGFVDSSSSTGNQTGAALIYVREGSNGYGNLSAYTKSSGGLNTERMRIDSNGQIGINTTAMKTTLSVGGTLNVTSTVYFDGSQSCDTLGTDTDGKVLCQVNGSGSSFDPVPLQQNDTYLNASINAVNTRVTTVNNSLQLALVNITDLQNSNASVKTRIDTVNSSLLSFVLILGQNDTNLNASINAVNTRATTINGTTVSLATNLTALSNTAITTFGVRLAGSNATMSNSSTVDFYCGSGISCNASTTAPRPGITITASAGGGNVSGGSINGTLGFVAMWNATTTITNTSLYVSPTTGSVLAGAYGSVSSPLFASALNPDSGYYTDSAGQFMVAGDGVKVFQANADGIQVAQGSSVFPGIQSTADDDTGPYWPADNIWAVTANGNGGGGQVANFSVAGLGLKNGSQYDTENTTSSWNASNNASVEIDAVNAGLNRMYMSSMTQNQNYFQGMDNMLTPTYSMWASALSSNTAASQIGPGGGAALALAVGSTFTNIAPAWGGPMLSCITGTAYNASCGYGRSTLYNTRLSGFYMTGTVVPITVGTTEATGQDIFMGLQSSVTLTSAGTNLTSITWGTNHSTAGSYVGFTLKQNLTGKTGYGAAWHFVASDATTSVSVNTTINFTAGHVYSYGINCPPSVAAKQCYGWMRDTNATAIEGRGEFMGNLSTNLPAAATTLSPAVQMTSKSGNARTIYVGGFNVMTFPWRY